MPDYAVSTTFTGKDKVSHLFGQMERAAGRYGNTAQNAFRGVGREADHASTALRNATKHGYKFGSIVKGILTANLIRGGIGFVTGGLQQLGTQFLEFDDTMVSAASKFDDVGLKSQDFGKKLQGLKEDWRSFALGTRYSASELSKSAEAFAEAGWDSLTAKGSTPYLIKAATAAREKDIANFTNVSLGLMQGFNLKTGNAAQDSKNFVVLLDQITQGALDAIGGITDLKESLKVLAPVWQESESSAATIAFASVLQNAGFPGDMVGTAGKNAKLRLARPDIVQGLKASGIDVRDAQTGRMKTTLQLFEEISAKMKKVGIKPGSPEDIAIQTMLFGSYSIAGNKSMLQHLGDYRKEMERIQNGSKNVAGDTADQINKYSTFSKVLMLLGAVTDKAFTVFERFNGAGQKGVEGLMAKIKSFNMEPFIDALTVTGKALWTLYTLVRPFIPILPYLVGGFIAWKAAMGALSFVKFIWSVGRMVVLAGQLFSILSGFGTVWAGLGVPATILTGIEALAVALTPVAAAALALAAVGSVVSAGYSAFTGKDNPISRLAQYLHIVPELEHDEEGNVTGRKGQWFPDAPNAKEAQARQMVQFDGQLNITGAPAGSTFTGNTYGAAPMLVNMGNNPK